MEGPTDHQYDAVAVEARRRTIGQLAGHEIHLEIVDVLDKNKNKDILSSLPLYVGGLAMYYNLFLSWLIYSIIPVTLP